MAARVRGPRRDRSPGPRHRAPVPAHRRDADGQQQGPDRHRPADARSRKRRDDIALRHDQASDPAPRVRSLPGPDQDLRRDRASRSRRDAQRRRVGQGEPRAREADPCERVVRAAAPTAMPAPQRLDLPELPDDRRVPAAAPRAARPHRAAHRASRARRPPRLAGTTAPSRVPGLPWCSSIVPARWSTSRRSRAPPASRASGSASSPTYAPRSSSSAATLATPSPGSRPRSAPARPRCASGSGRCWRRTRDSAARAPSYAPSPPSPTANNAPVHIG